MAIKRIPALWFALFLAGCVGSGIDVDLPDAPPSETYRLGSHNVTLIPGARTATQSSGVDSYELSSGDRRVAIIAGELFVNGVSYGPLEEGDAVTVDGNRVSIDGIPAEPQVKAAPEFAGGLDESGEKETRLELGGHPIVIRPPARNIAQRTDASGRHFLAADDYEVMIWNDHLTVNGIGYGKLEADDGVTLQDYRVYINDEPAEPLLSP